MQEQLDMLILDRVANGHFDVNVQTEHYRHIEKEYKSRGFRVRTHNTGITVISWKNPHLDSMQQPNKKIFSLFTAQQLYYVLTNGKDHRHLTNASVYQKLIREKSIIDTHGMSKLAAYNLFREAIENATAQGFNVVVDDSGVISSTKVDNITHHPDNRPPVEGTDPDAEDFDMIL